MISRTLAQLGRGFKFPLIEFIVNIFEYSVFSFSYGTLEDFVKTIDCCFGKNCCLGTLEVTVKFCDFEHTSSIKKTLYTLTD